MDKDSIIIKHEQEVVAETEASIDELAKSNDTQEKRLREIQEKISELYQKQEKEPLKVKVKRKLEEIKNPKNQDELSYDELFDLAETSLKERGLSTDNFDYSDLISEEELDKIIKELNSPLPREDKWKKSDFIVVFIAAVLGAIADMVLGNRDNKLTGKNSKFSEKLNELHNHKDGAPIDYQGKHFGGGYHRSRSSGHDILRPLKGIKQFKNGEFIGKYFEAGNPIEVISNANQFGKSYDELSWIEATTRWIGHMLADFCSKASLPFPGYSYFSEANNRNLRKLTSTLYTNGLNCKNMATQSFTAILIEFIIRIYFGIQSIRNLTDNELEIKEDYSNFDKIKEFILPTNKEKLHEMLLVAHSIVAGINVGKITIKCLVKEDISSLASINIAEIMAVIRYGFSVTKATLKRHDKYAKLIYHADDTNNEWLNLEKEMLDEQILFLGEKTDTLVV